MNSENKCVVGGVDPSRTRVLKPAFMLLFVAMLFGGHATREASAQAYANDVKVLKKLSFKNEPIDLVSIEADGAKIYDGQSFNRSGDWLSGLSFTFKNASGKPIVYVAIVLLFPETEGHQPQVVHFLEYGINPLAQQKAKESGFDLVTEETPKLLHPGDSDIITLTPKSYTHLKQFLQARRPLSELKQAKFQIMVVCFQDGTSWSPGS